MTRIALGNRHEVVAAKARAFVRSDLTRIHPIQTWLDLHADRFRAHGAPHLIDLSLRSRCRSVEKHHRPTNVHDRPLLPSNIAQLRHRLLHVATGIGIDPLHKDSQPLEVRGPRRLIPENQGPLTCTEPDYSKIVNRACRVVVVTVRTGPLVQRLLSHECQRPARGLYPDLHNPPLSRVTVVMRSHTAAALKPTRGGHR